jgi:hypothetical protein
MRSTTSCGLLSGRFYVGHAVVYPYDRLMSEPDTRGAKPFYLKMSEKSARSATLVLVGGSARSCHRKELVWSASPDRNLWLSSRLRAMRTAEARMGASSFEDDARSSRQQDPDAGGTQVAFQTGPRQREIRREERDSESESGRMSNLPSYGLIQK